ncbi:MAG: sugar-binding domain-containing protein [Alkalispirochaeta sp.]|jgi:DNA-binding transcriptional regulator LsrR (DeoR family)
MSSKLRKGLTSSERNYLGKIARLYYLEDLSQQHIARRMNVSIATVSRTLNKARQYKIVKILIDESPDGAGEMEQVIEQRWNLQECTVVAGHDHLENTYQQMASVMTDLLSRLVQPGSTVGVSWGVTLKTIGENLGSVPGQDVKVIPIIGAMGEVDTGIYPNGIAREFAEHLRGKPYMVNIPAVVDDRGIRDSMLRDSYYRSVRQIWESLDIAIMSVSGLDEDTSMFRTGIFSAEELATLRQLGGTCATNFSVLDANGQVLENPISGRIVGLPFPELEDVRHVVIAAAGRSKAMALRSALNSGVVTRLITDVECAQLLLGE